MKKIKMTIDNIDNLQKELDNAQKRCKVRKFKALELYEKAYSILNIHADKTALKGTTFSIASYSGYFPQSYKGKPECTFAEFEYTSALYCIAIFRATVPANQYHLNLSESAKNSIIKNIENFKTGYSFDPLKDIAEAHPFSDDQLKKVKIHYNNFSCKIDDNMTLNFHLTNENSQKTQAFYWQHLALVTDYLFDDFYDYTKRFLQLKKIGFEYINDTAYTLYYVNNSAPFKFLIEKNTF